uniref:MADF domain-containing protein n=1 Tax=Anopheles funestus TaxID=62324 RepID=A0A182RMM3_ANOFN
MEEAANTSTETIMVMGAPTQQHDFKWTHERCMLLLHEYDLLKDKFKDRKHKKKDLWAEISMKFKKIYAYDLEWDVAYKKFRNLKQTAKLQQQAITGQHSNRPKWPYFEKFQQILDDPVGPSYSYSDPLQQQQQQQQQQHLHHLSDEQDDDHNHHNHHHHHHHHHHHKHQSHMHPHLDPPTVDQVLVGEDFSDGLVTVFPMNEELEIPAQPADDSVDEENVDQKEIVVQTAIGEEDEEEEGEPEAEQNQAEECLEEEEEALVDQPSEEVLEETPHRKRFRRLSMYEQERLMIEREKLVTLREIQRGIECKNDILRGILHVLQARVWQAHPAMD